MVYYLFDGSYTGFFCCVFDYFYIKHRHVVLCSDANDCCQLFADLHRVESNKINAERVVKKLTQIVKKDIDAFYQVFLSEDPIAIQYAFELVIQIFKGQQDILSNFGNTNVLYFSKTLKKVNRERHRMKAFIRFKKSKNGVFIATVEPDFNVLPLIYIFFRNRYTDQPWIIYDLKRNYGFHYDLQNVSEVQFTEAAENDITTSVESLALDDDELLFQQLWKSYFKSTTIAARKNIKLHLRHVPKRYWKYLPEK